MNRIQVKVEKIESNEQLTLLSLRSKSHKLSMMSLELSPDITEKKELIVSTKAANIAIAKDYDGVLSYSNQLSVEIASMEMGKLLCSLDLLFEETILESIITTHSANRMQLQVGDRVTALIKASDIAIKEILS
jgi:molybdopterin-binding protein